ncbi:hypothetical protein [Gynuella sunshinyii]|uniref:Response regulatory domain-containing protein n=1 Tax=Gynuella sunshinyii YC6258 TaxID=1445510 RepID=A0A0C5VVC2_9GAMM|nr:hypothetical protein [Gynuella sunshinyii]AJQ97233.1 hypothetical Protein YC6258_05203 [Gynuella sunshinyii YC6258]
MRVAITRRGNYHADVYCEDTHSAKRVLKENSISVLAIDFYLNGRGDGKSILEWARTKALLPQFVVITETDRSKRALLTAELSKAGYASSDNTNFIRTKCQA